MNKTSIGESLKNKRENMKISLQKASESTKISIKYLEALEKNEFSILPSPTHVKLFLKAYAKYLNLDYEPMKREYESMLEEEEKKKKEQYQKIIILKEKREKKKKSIILILLLLSFFLTLFFYTFPKLKRKDINIRNIPIVTKVEENNIKIVANEDCWIELAIDDNVVYQGIMKPQEEKIWTGKKQFRLWIGNPRGIKIFINEKKLNFEIEPGKIIKYLYIYEDGSYKISK